MGKYNRCTSCGRETRNSGLCIVCELDAKNPKQKEFADSIRGKVKIHKEKSKMPRHGESPYSRHYVKKEKTK